jgi:hypothetical protein
MMHALPELRGYDPVNSRRYGLFMNQMTHQPLTQNPRAFMFVPDTHPEAVDWRLMALLDTRIALSYYPFENPALAPAAQWEFTEPDQPAQTLRAFRLKNPAGPAWLAAPLTLAPDTPLEEIATLLGSPRFDPRAMAVVEGDALAYLEEEPALKNSAPAQSSFPSPAGERGSTARRSGAKEAGEGDFTALAPSVQLRSKRSGSLAFDVSTPRAQVLVVSQSYYPGWQARVDGRPAPVLPANVALCAVGVPAGRHTVELAYRPRPFAQGAAISAASMLLLALIAARRRRRY